MLIISFVEGHALDKTTLADEKFTDSQRLRMQSIKAYREAGIYWLKIKAMLAPATPKNPIETDLGTFSSFNDYLTKRGHPKRAIYDHIKLAENWHIVLGLGMQDASNSTAISKSMRLCRTLKIIKWANDKIEDGTPLSQLTLDQYWEETEGSLTLKDPSRPSYMDILKERDFYKEAYEQASAELTQLKQANAALVSELGSPALTP